MVFPEYVCVYIYIYMRCRHVGHSGDVLDACMKAHAWVGGWSDAYRDSVAIRLALE